MAVDLSVFDKIRNKSDYDRAEQEFNLRKQVLLGKAQGSEGATVGAAKMLMQADPTLDFPTAFSIAKSGLGQGNTYSGGQVTNMTGAPEAFGGIEYGKQTGQNESDLAYKPRIAADTKSAEMRSTVGTEAQLNLPKNENQSQQMIDLINSIEKHPGLSASVGVKNPFQGAIPFTDKAVAGTPSADFNVLLDQLGGKQFLQAFESLKGGGQITEVEGKKATDAIAALSKSQSEDQFIANLNIFKGIVNSAIERQRNMAGVSAPQAPSGDPLQESLDAIAAQQNAVGTNPMQRENMTKSNNAAKAEMKFKLKKQGFSDQDINDFLAAEGM